MPVIHCHNCAAQFSVPSNTGECPRCGGGFVEEVAAAPQVRTVLFPPAACWLPERHAGRRHASACPQAAPSNNGRTFSRTYTTPGGGLSFQIVTSTGGGGSGGMPPGFPGFPGGGGGDPMIQSILDIMARRWGGREVENRRLAQPCLPRLLHQLRRPPPPPPAQRADAPHGWRRALPHAATRRGGQRAGVAGWNGDAGVTAGRVGGAGAAGWRRMACRGVEAERRAVPASSLHTSCSRPAACPSPPSPCAAQLMNEYVPPTQATSERALRSLPTLKVRAAAATGEPGEGEAICKAGEPCSVW